MIYTKAQKKRLKRAVRQLTAPYFDRLAGRAESVRRIAAIAEGGQIALVHGGIDCDGTRVDNEVDLVPANVLQLERAIDGLYDGAEGPVWFHVDAPSNVRDLRPGVRDLALEAFENGHAHVLRV